MQVNVFILIGYAAVTIKATIYTPKFGSGSTQNSNLFVFLGITPVFKLYF